MYAKGMTEWGVKGGERVSVFISPSRKDNPLDPWDRGPQETRVSRPNPRKFIGGLGSQYLP